MEKLKIGVIGCGRISVVYLDAFKRLKDRIEVVFAVDKDIARARNFSQSFDSCKYSDNVDDMLQQKAIDVVHVLTPHFLHKEHVIGCLKAGFHVLTEKPIATTMEDALLMCKAAKETNLKLGVIFQNRYIDGIVEVKKMLDEQKFGKITGAWSTLNWWRPPSYYECDWKGDKIKEGGGVVIDQAIHSIDLVRYLMGCEVHSIKGHIDNRILKQIEVEDVADAAITFTNGAVYSFYACNYFTSNSPIQIEISTEKGSISLVGDVVTIKLDGKERTIKPKFEKLSEGESYWGEFHYHQIKDFYEKLKEEKPVPFSPEDATKTLEIVLGIYQSSKENKVVYLN